MMQVVEMFLTIFAGLLLCGILLLVVFWLIVEWHEIYRLLSICFETRTRFIIAKKKERMQFVFNVLFAIPVIAHVSLLLSLIFTAIEYGWWGNYIIAGLSLIMVMMIAGIIGNRIERR